MDGKDATRVSRTARFVGGSLPCHLGYVLVIRTTVRYPRPNRVVSMVRQTIGLPSRGLWELS